MSLGASRDSRRGLIYPEQLLAQGHTFRVESHTLGASVAQDESSERLRLCGAEPHLAAVEQHLPGGPGAGIRETRTDPSPRDPWEEAGAAAWTPPHPLGCPRRWGRSSASRRAG